MRHVRMLTVCLVAAFAVAAIAATSSSAMLPEWGKCVKTPAIIKGVEHKKGAYADANCTAKTGGEFEFVKGTSELPTTSFTNTMTSAEAVLETALGVQVKCTAETATGNLSGTKEVSNVEVRFKGCKANLLELSCEGFFEQKEGVFVYTEGEVITRRLKGKLGYISGKGTATPVVGLALEPEEKKGLFAFFGCGSKGGAPVIFSEVGAKPTGKNGGDSIISPISPVNKMGKETTQVYAEKKVENPETKEIETAKGIQEPTNFEGGRLDVLETYLVSSFGHIEWAQSGQEETAVTKLTSEEELEIKA